ncbi:MAG: hypothetical protein AAFX79_08125 [Planctomycetota bacterium]
MASAALAKELVLLMEGACVTRQVTGDEESGRTARGVAQLLLDHRLGGAPLPLSS